MFSRIVLVLAISSNVFFLQAEDFLTSVFGNAKAYINMDARYEYVDQANALKDANAFVLRSQLGIETESFGDFSGVAEFSHLTDLFGVDSFNSTKNGKAGIYSTVADPDTTELNQIFIDYKGIPDSRIRLGRQEIILDNSRFVGNVGWRLNEQTYDGATLTNQSIPDTKLTYGYIDKVQTFVDTTIEHDTHILNAKYSGLEAGDLVAYFYSIKNEDVGGGSSNTHGLSFDGQTKINDSLTALYRVEYAHQNDAHNNPATFSLDYYHLNVGAKFSAITTKLGYERMEGDGTTGFAFPLGTNHAFNGWADLFLTTPATGLKDAYAMIGTDIFGIKTKAFYHQFDSENTSADYGNEFDLLFVKPINKNYKVLVKYANYNADTFGVNTQKVWVGFKVQFQQ